MATTASRQHAETRYREKWGWLAARGVVAILFGILTLAWPGMTLVALVIAYGAFALIDGVASLGFAARGGKTLAGKTWPLVLTGLAGIGAGIAAFLWPGLTGLVLLYIVAFWSLARGLFEVVAYFPLRKEIDNAWLLLASGVLSVGFGLALLFWPVAGILAVLWVIGVYAIAAGIALVALAFSIRSKVKRKEPPARRHEPPAEATPA